MQGLGRVNLLVGANNCGKTSVLECIQLLRSPGALAVLSDITVRRGEWGYLSDEDPADPRVRSPDLSRLFANRELRGQIRIEADRSGDIASAGWNSQVRLYVEHPTSRDLDEWRAGVPEGAEDECLVLHVECSDPDDHHKVLLTDEGLLVRPGLPRSARRGSIQTAEFVRATGMTAGDAARTLSRFVLTPKEDAITNALRLVEPAIERIAPVADDHGYPRFSAPGG